MKIKNNKNLTLHPFDPMNRIGWEKQRESLQGMDDLTKPIKLGGSDIGIIMGLSDYKARGALYYEMIGMKTIEPFNNPHIYRGHAQEQVAIDWYWRYFDPQDGKMDGVMAAQRAGNVLRQSKPLHAMVENKQFKGVFSNVDQLIMPDENVLEIKSMYNSALDKWEAGIPPYQIVQLMSYLMVLEKDEGEIFIMVDATFPIMFQFKASEEMQRRIMEAVTDFTLRVNSARKEIAKLTDPDDAWTVAYEYEPPAEMTLAYIKFLKDTHQPDNMAEPLHGDMETLNHVIDYSKIKAKQSDLEALLVPHRVHIMKEFNDNGVKEIDFPGHDYPPIKWDKKLSIQYKKFLS